MGEDEIKRNIKDLLTVFNYLEKTGKNLKALFKPEPGLKSDLTRNYFFYKSKILLWNEKTKQTNRRNWKLNQYFR